MRRFLPILAFAAACAAHIEAGPVQEPPTRHRSPDAPARAVPAPASDRDLPAAPEPQDGAAVEPARREAGLRLPAVDPSETTARVLMYHTFGWVKPRPGVQAHQLRDQLDWMRDNDVEVVRMSQLVEFLDGELRLPARVAVITIDDGERNGYTRAFPIFREYGVPFTLGIATEAVQKWRSRGTFQWHQAREMVDSGLCEIASHSHTHRRLTVLPDGVLNRELELSRRLIEENTGFRPEVFFYPLGAHDSRTRRLTREAGYRAGFAASGAPVRHRTDRFRIPRYDVTGHTGLWTFARFFQHG